MNVGEATSVIRLGVYGHDTSTDRPGALIVDGGTIDASTTGLKTVTIGASIPLGIVWIGGVAQTASSTMRVYGGNPYVLRIPGDANGATAGQGITAPLSPERCRIRSARRMPSARRVPLWQSGGRDGAGDTRSFHQRGAGSH